MLLYNIRAHITRTQKDKKKERLDHCRNFNHVIVEMRIMVLALKFSAGKFIDREVSGVKIREFFSALSLSAMLGYLRVYTSLRVSSRTEWVPELELAQQEACAEDTNSDVEKDFLRHASQTGWMS